MKGALGVLITVVLFLSTAAVVEAQVSHKEIYKVEVREFYISPFDLQCKTDVVSIVNVYNKGNIDATIYAEVANDELGISEFSPSIKIQAGRKQGVAVPFILEEAVEGTYHFDIRLYTEEGIQHLLHTVRFEGCEKERITLLVPNAPKVIEKPPMKDEEIETKITLPTHFLIGLGLLGLLGVLAGLYIITAYFKDSETYY